MSYDVILHPRAAKYYRKLPAGDKERVKLKLNDLKNPFDIPAIKIQGKEDI